MKKVIVSSALLCASMAFAQSRAGNAYPQDKDIVITDGLMNGYGWFGDRPPTVSPTSPSPGFYDVFTGCPKDAVCYQKDFWYWSDRNTYLKGLLDGAHYNKIDCGQGIESNPWAIVGAIWSANPIDLMAQIDDFYRDPGNLKIPVVRALDYLENRATWGPNDPALRVYLGSQRERANTLWQATAEKWRKP